MKGANQRSHALVLRAKPGIRSRRVAELETVAEDNHIVAREYHDSASYVAGGTFHETWVPVVNRQT